MLVDVRATIETRWSQVADFVGLRAVLYDQDPLVDDLLAEGTVESGGVIHLRFDATKVASFDSPRETAPDLRLVIVCRDRRMVFRSRVVANVRIPAVAAGDERPLCDVVFTESSLD